MCLLGDGVMCDLVEMKEVDEGVEERAETPVLRVTQRKIQRSKCLVRE